MDLRRFIAKVFSPFARRSSTSSSAPADPRHLLGRQGERAAARFLRKRGYKILYRNYRAPGGGEVDLVCRDGKTLVFVEVKTRSSVEHGTPFEAVTAQKRKLITRGAMAWLGLLHYPDIIIRFDVVEVLRSGSQRRQRLVPHLIQDAFRLPEHYRV